MKRPKPFNLSPRGWIVYGHDVVMAGAAMSAAFYLRLGDDLTFWFETPELIGLIALFTATAAAVFLFSGMYRGVWLYASLSDLFVITRSVSVTVLLFIVIMFLWTRLDDVPRSVPLITWFVLMAFLGGPRFLYRMWKDWPQGRRRDDGAGRVPVLLIGAGDECALFIRALSQPRNAGYRAVGILALRQGREGRQILGVDVLGHVSNAETVLDQLAGRNNRPRRILLTRDGVEGSVVRELVEIAARRGVPLARLPKATDFRSETGDTPVTMQAIAVEDLLGRPQTPLDRESMAGLVRGRRVVVTGAGGSIGSELCRQAAGLNPSLLVMLDLSEYALYLIDHELGSSHPELARRAVLGDVRDRTALDRLFGGVRPELVFHAAALKHVPLVEANPMEGFASNTIGTLNVAEAARRAGVQAMVMISTDKAVNPSSVMGATKRLAEICCQSFDQASDQGNEPDTRFVTVRFGNVLGSTGSVVPLFQKQLAAGGPLTVTHPDMTRYFMTTREAVELVLQASVMGLSSGADGRIFVLDMGEPVKIIDLARQMIRLSGKVPGDDVKIIFTGLRPGEKLSEEIFHGDEAPVPTTRPGILLAKPRSADLEVLRARIAVLETAVQSGDQESAARVLRQFVPEYSGAFCDETGGPGAVSRQFGS